MTSVKKYIVLITSLMFITVCGVVIFSRFTNKQVEKIVTKEYVEHIRDMAKGSVLSISNDLSLMKLMVTIVSDEIIEHDFYKDNDDFKRDFLSFHSIMDAILVYDINYIDENGKLKYTMNMSEPIGSDFSNSSFFNVIKNKNDPKYIDVRLVELKGTNSGDRGILFSKGVFAADDGNGFKGAVLVSSTLSSFIERHIQPFSPHRRDYIWLFDSKGMILRHPDIYTGKTYNEIRISKFYTDSFKNTIDNIIRGKKTTGEYEEKGIDYVFAAEKVNVGIHDWFVVISAPEEETKATLKNYSHITFMLNFTALFAVLLFGFFLILIFYIRNQRLLQTVDIRTYQLEYARKKNKELDAIIHTIAHDIKSPLTSVMGFSIQILQESSERGLSDDIIHYLERIKNNAYYMKELVDSLLEFARIGEITSNFEDVPLNEAFKEVILQLNYLIESREAVIDIPKDLPTVHVDRLKIIQVFLNLISNAIRFVPEERQPVVNVTFNEDDNFYNISISDNGIGVNSTEIESIFNIFHRIGEINVPGTGVGLAIVKKIINDHMGIITVKSTKGEGTTFTISLKKYDIGKDKQH